MSRPRWIPTLFLGLALGFNAIFCQGATNGLEPAASCPTGAVISWGVGLPPNPLPPELESDVIAVATGGSESVALKADRTVVTWSNNSNLRTTVPVQVQSGIIAVAAGSGYLAALASDGSVVTWSNGTTFPVPNGAEGNVTAIAVGSRPTTALKRDGRVLAWNVDNVSLLPIPFAAQANVKAIAAGVYHALFLKPDGSVVGWGYTSGQLTVPTEALSGVVAIACGTSHSVALKQDGSVIAWGDNRYGQATVPIEAKSEVVAIAAGDFTLALKANGSVMSWGAVPPFIDWPGEKKVPLVPMAAQSGVFAISALTGHALALVTPSAPQILAAPESLSVNEVQPVRLTVATSGYPMSFQWRKDSVDIPGATSNTFNLKNAFPIDSGEYSVVVRNSFGTLTSSPPARLTVNPTPGWLVGWPDSLLANVPPSVQGGIIAVAIGLDHAVALKADGSIVAWGDPPTFWGPSLGLTVIPVAARSGVTAIAAGVAHTLALKFDGSVVVWGVDYTNAFGQVSNYGQMTVPASARSGVVSILARLYYNLALKADGSVVAWGANDSGQTRMALN